MADRRPVVLAISRQLASGGAFVGQAVARRCAMKYVDREVLEQAAAELGVDDLESIQPLEERADTMWTRLTRFMVVGGPDATYVPPPPHIHETVVQEAEARIIRAIAVREEAVIVGRGAAHLLRDRPHVVRLFVHAPAAYRIAELQRLYEMTAETARAAVQKTDRDRTRFVEAISGRPWHDATQYDLSIDTSLVSIDVAAEIVSRVIEERRHDVNAV